MFWCWLLVLSFSLFVNGNYPIRSAHCHRNEFNLQNTLSIGIVDNWIVQITINLELIMYPRQSTEFLTLSRGYGGKLEELYPAIKNIQAYQLMKPMNPSDLLLRVAIAVQKDAKKSLFNIYGYVYIHKDTYYFIQPFNGTGKPTAHSNFEIHFYRKIISIWTANGIGNGNFHYNNLHLAMTAKHEYVLLKSANLRSLHGFFCFNRTAIKLTEYFVPNCIQNKYWIYDIRFIFIFRSRIHFVSIKLKRVWSVNQNIILKMNQYYPLQEENYFNLFNCTLDDNYINTDSIQFNPKIFWLIILTTIVLIIILIISATFNVIFYWRSKQFITEYSETTMSTGKYCEHCMNHYLQETIKNLK